MTDTIAIILLLIAGCLALYWWLFRYSCVNKWEYYVREEQAIDRAKNFPRVVWQKFVKSIQKHSPAGGRTTTPDHDSKAASRLRDWLGR